MNTRFISVEADTSVEYLIKDYFSVHMKSAFPVTKTNGYLVGMVTLKNAMTVPEHRRQAMKAEDVMTPLIDLIVMNQNRKADEAMQQMIRNHTGKIFVCDQAGRLIGLLSKTDIMNVAGERHEYIEESERLVE